MKMLLYIRKHEGGYKMTLEEKSYIYGLFLTDGSIDIKDYNSYTGTIRLELNYKDKDIIEKLYQIIPYSSIHERTRATNFSQEHHTIIFSNSRKDFISILINMGFPIENKTINACPPICEYDINAFWRGVIDGDGSLGIRQGKNGLEAFLSLTTKSELLRNAFCNYLSSITREQYNPKRNIRDGVYNIGCGTSSTKKVIDKLYSNATIYLNRKYNKMLEINQFIKDNNIQIKRNYILQQITSEGVVIAQYPTCAEAQRKTGFTHLADASNPSKPLKLKNGYYWKRIYEDK